MWPVYTVPSNHPMFYTVALGLWWIRDRYVGTVLLKTKQDFLYIILLLLKKIYSGGFTVSREGKKIPFHLFPLHYNWQLYSVSFKFPLSLLLIPFFYIFFTLIFNIYVVKLCSFELYFVLFSCPLFVFIFTSFYFKLHSFSFIFFYDPLFLWVTIRSVF